MTDTTTSNTDNQSNVATTQKTDTSPATTTWATPTPEQVTTSTNWFFDTITNGIKSWVQVVTRPFGWNSATPETLAQELKILDEQWAIDPSKVNGVEKMKFWPDVDIISFVHGKTGKKYVTFANPRRTIPLKGAYKIVWHIRIFDTDYLQYENSYFIPLNQRCMCDIHGEIFLDNYKYIDPMPLLVNGQECIKVAYDYGDANREVFTLVNKTGHRLWWLNFTVEKIEWVLPIAIVRKKREEVRRYFNVATDTKNKDLLHLIDTNIYEIIEQDMLVFDIFDKKYILWIDGEWIPISDPVLINDMLQDTKKTELLKWF
jgi:hypothetical protein